MKEEKKHKETIDRRSFLKRAWVWLGVIAGIEFTALSVNMFLPGRKNKTNLAATTKNAGFLDNILPGSVTPFKDGLFYLVRLEDGGLLALSLTCTHLGCSVGFNAEKDLFVCPCHSSVFDLTGNVLSPPAPRALDTYRVFIEQGEVKVDTSRKIKRTKFSKEDIFYA
jgi:cytochrome b6-f complex iron-sulfur subunit